MPNNIDTPAAVAADSPLGSDYLTDKQLAKELRISTRTFARLHEKRQGPPRVRVGRKVFYRRASAIAWLESREEVPVASRRPPATTANKARFARASSRSFQQTTEVRQKRRPRSWRDLSKLKG